MTPDEILKKWTNAKREEPVAKVAPPPVLRIIHVKKKERDLEKQTHRSPEKNALWKFLADEFPVPIDMRQFVAIRPKKLWRVKVAPVKTTARPEGLPPSRWKINIKYTDNTCLTLSTFLARYGYRCASGWSKENAQKYFKTLRAAWGLNSDGFPKGICKLSKVENAQPKVDKQKFDQKQNSTTGVYFYSFATPLEPNVTYTRPYELRIGDERYSLEGNWRNLILKIAAYLVQQDPCLFTISIAHEQFFSRIFSYSKEKMRTPGCIDALGKKLWVELNLSAKDILHYSRKACQVCRVVQLDRIKLVYGNARYAPKDTIKTTGDVKQGKLSSATQVSETQERRFDLSKFESVIQSDYPNGFDFSESAKRLVEAKVGTEFSMPVSGALQSRMFARKDGLWFFKNQIASQEVCSEVVKQVTDWLLEFGIVPLNRLGALLIGRSIHLEDEQALRDFAEMCVQCSKDGSEISIVGRRSNRFCFLASEGEEVARKRFAEKLRAILLERMDAVRIVELIENIPSITEDWLIENVSGFVPDAIVDDLGDGNYAVKLLEFYYLPENFGETLNATLSSLKASDEPLSSARIHSELNIQMGDADIFETYALSEMSFRQIVKSYVPVNMRWRGSILMTETDAENKSSLSFKETIEQHFSGVFSFEELMKFGRTIWGWKEENRGWQRQQLWHGFIRYDANHWSSIGCLTAIPNWVEVAQVVTQVLETLLNTRPFFSLAHVTRHTLDSLPTLIVDGHEWPWTPELLASVAYHCLSNVAVINHAKAPNILTTLLVPFGTKDESDGIGYMVKLYQQQSLGSATIDGAFEFLHENNVRMNNTRKLRQEIDTFLKETK